MYTGATRICNFINVKRQGKLMENSFMKNHKILLVNPSYDSLNIYKFISVE